MSSKKIVTSVVTTIVIFAFCLAVNPLLSGLSKSEDSAAPNPVTASNAVLQEPPSEPLSIAWVHPVPQSINAGHSEMVSIYAMVEGGASIIRDSANLLRYSSQGETPTVVGKLYDDGTHGDAKAEDNIFTTQVTLSEPKPTVAIFAVSVAFKGQLKRAVSIPASIFIKSTITAQQMTSMLANDIGRGDIESALTRFSDSPLNRETLTSLDNNQKMKLATALRQSKTIKDNGDYQVIHVPWEKEDKTVRQYEVVLARNGLGEWQIISW